MMAAVFQIFLQFHNNEPKFLSVPPEPSHDDFTFEWTENQQVSELKLVVLRQNLGQQTLHSRYLTIGCVWINT